MIIRLAILAFQFSASWSLILGLALGLGIPIVLVIGGVLLYNVKRKKSKGRVSFSRRDSEISLRLVSVKHSTA